MFSSSTICSPFFFISSTNLGICVLSRKSTNPKYPSFLSTRFTSERKSEKSLYQCEDSTLITKPNELSEKGSLCTSPSINFIKPSTLFAFSATFNELLLISIPTYEFGEKSETRYFAPNPLPQPASK